MRGGEKENSWIIVRLSFALTRKWFVPPLFSNIESCKCYKLLQVIRSDEIPVKIILVYCSANFQPSAVGWKCSSYDYVNKCYGYIRDQTHLMALLLFEKWFTTSTSYDLMPRFIACFHVWGSISVENRVDPLDLSSMRKVLWTFCNCLLKLLLKGVEG